MVLISASHIDSLIVYEQYDGSGGESHILWVSASNHVDRDQTPPKGSQIVQTLKKCNILSLWHFIWVFSVSQSTCLRISSIQWVVRAMMW